MKYLAKAFGLVLATLALTVPVMGGDDESKPKQAPEKAAAPSGPADVKGGASLDGETQTSMTADEIAKQLANPNTPLASLTFKNQFTLYRGDLPDADDQWNYTLLFQPVFPFSAGETPAGGKGTIFFRPAIPLLVEAPAFDAGNRGFRDVTALGDIGFDLAYGGTEKNGLLWAVGMVGTLPTATDERVAGKELLLGPEALLAKFEDWGVYGVFPSHQWNVAGWSDEYVSKSQCQLFFNLFAGNGWTVGTTPVVQYDWNAEQWTVPVNLTFSKTLKAGNTPVKLAMEINYYVEQADAFGPEWLISFNVTPVVENIFDKWVHGPRGE